jgi:hypothetical protein
MTGVKPGFAIALAQREPVAKVLKPFSGKSTGAGGFLFWRKSENISERENI